MALCVLHLINLPRLLVVPHSIDIFYDIALHILGCSLNLLKPLGVLHSIDIFYNMLTAVTYSRDIFYMSLYTMGLFNLLKLPIVTYSWNILYIALYT